MMLTSQEPPSRADGSGFITLAMFNVHSGRNGGLESALRAMAATEVDCGVLTKTKIMATYIQDIHWGTMFSP